MLAGSAGHADGPHVGVLDGGPHEGSAESQHQLLDA